MVTFTPAKEMVKGILTSLVKKTYVRTGTVRYIKYNKQNEPVEIYTPEELGI